MSRTPVIAQVTRERVVRSKSARLQGFVAANIASKSHQSKQLLSLQTFLETSTAQKMLSLADADKHEADEEESSASSEDNALDQAIRKRLLQSKGI